VAEELVPKIGEDPLAGPAGEVGLCCARDHVRQRGDQEQGNDDGERVEVAVLDPVVERELRKVRRCERGQRGG
jgi:hypothetical protein